MKTYLLPKDRHNTTHVCFEPWNGRPDYDGEITELLEKEDMTILAKDCENKHSFTITIE